MKQAFAFVGKHWFTLGLLAGAIVLVVWIVSTQRAPGSMTIVEAQGMDMTTSKPPPGALVVDVAMVGERSSSKEEVFPAAVAALTEEDVVARVAGRLRNLTVYPGDMVRAGQLLGTLDAAELDAQVAAARDMAASRAASIKVAEQEIEQRRKMVERAKSLARGADAALARVKEEQETAYAEAESKRSEIGMARADVDEKDAELEYAERNLTREKRLYEQQAISLDELQGAQKEREAAKARRAASLAKVKAAQADAASFERKFKAAAHAIEEALAARDAAQTEVRQAEIELAKARAESRVTRLEASAAAVETNAASIQAGYRELRASGAGVVAERLVSPGTAVEAGQVILKLKTVGSVRVQADLPSRVASLARTGMAVEVITDTGTVRASITSVFPALNEETRTLRVEARVPNLDGKLSPGMFARVRLMPAAGLKSMSVPSKAIQIAADGTSYVWVMAERKGQTAAKDWTCTMHPTVSNPGAGKCPLCQMALVPRDKLGRFVAERRPVRSGASNDDWTAVIDGLTAHEMVVTSQLERLQPGMAIAAREVDAQGMTH